MELRILVHAPRGRDASVIGDVLRARGIEAVRCENLDALIGQLSLGAAGVLVTEEALGPLTADPRLVEWLGRQPPWSDLPFAVLASHREGRRRPRDAQALRILGNVILLERPLNAETLASAAESAVRERQRQYATRAHLAELDRTRAQLVALNGELETRILERTRELSRANDRLMKEIAEREKAQIALSQLQKLEAIGRLTGGIAHDFNNLLHVVNMNLELVSLYAKEEKVKPVVERAKSAARRGSKLTGQLLSFARSQSLAPRLTDVNRLIAGMRDLIEISAGSSVAVELELRAEPAAVVLDSAQLEMAILNLAVNARDAMGEGGILTIATRRLEPDEPAPGDGAVESAEAAGGQPPLVGERVLISVHDTGEGIAPNVLPKVFDPFFTTKPLGSGTGLGLSQVYGFARQSGGRAHIRSELGKGTTVDLVFPAARGTEVTGAPVAARALRRDGTRRNVLVVEDDDEVRRVIGECLELLGYSVTVCADGAAGLAALAQARPDVLVVDFAMPGLNGAQVISRAREIAGELPVIMATGYADMAEVERLVGAVTLLRKPFDINALEEAMEQVLAGPAQVLAP